MAKRKESEYAGDVLGDALKAIDAANKAKAILLKTSGGYLKMLESQRKEFDRHNKQIEDAQKLMSDTLEIAKSVPEMYELANKKIAEQRNELRKSGIEQNESFYSLASSISQLSSVYEPFKKDLQQSIASTLTINSSFAQIRKENETAFTTAATRVQEIADLSVDLAQLNSEDVNERAIKTEQIYSKQAELSNLLKEMVTDGRELNAEEQLLVEKLGSVQEKLMGTVEEATKFSQLSKEAKDIATEMATEIETMQKTFKKVGEYARLAFQQPAVLLPLIGAQLGKVADAIGTVNKATGEFYSGLAASTGVLSLIFDDAVNVTQSLAKNLGDSRKASFGLQLSTNLAAINMGITGEEAGSLVNTLGGLSGNTEEGALNMMKATQEAAKLSGVLPSQALADMAGNAESLVLLAQGSAKEFAKAAIQAAQLGTSLQTTAKIADTLLDFETSIEKELELSALVGKDINLARARDLFYAGKTEEAMKEVLAQAGSYNEFINMGYYGQKAMADALGVSVEELANMLQKQENLNTTSGTIQGKFDKMSESLKAFGSSMGGTIITSAFTLLGVIGQAGLGMQALGFKAGFFGTIMKGLGMPFMFLWKAIIGMGTAIQGNIAKSTIFSGIWKLMGAPFRAIGMAISFMGSGISTLITRMATAMGIQKAWAAASAAMGFGKAAPVAPPTPPPAPAPASAMGKGFNAGAMLKGAAAILILSVALFVAAKAFQEFASVEWSAVGIGLVALGGLMVMAKLLSKGSAEMIKGAAAIAVLGVAMIPFAFGLSLLKGVDAGAVMAATLALVVFSVAAAAMGQALSVIALGAVAILLLGASMIGFSYALSLMAGVDLANILAVATGLYLFGAAAAILGSMVAAVLMGSVAIVVLGAAMVGFSYALSMMQGVDMANILAVAAGLGLFGIAVAGIGLLTPLILMGSVGVLALSAALIPFSYALSTLNAVDIGLILSVAGSLLAFGIAVAGIGFLTPLILMGSVGLLALSAALIPFSYALSTLNGVDVGAVLSVAGSLIAFGLAVAGLGFLTGPILMGGVALLALSASLIPFTYALNFLSGVDMGAVLSVAGSLIAFGLAVAGLGFLTGPILMGSVAVLALSAAMIPFTYALNFLSGVDMGAVLSVAGSLIAFGLAVAGLGFLTAPILMGSVALLALSAAMIPFSMALSRIVGVDMASILAVSTGIGLFGVGIAGLGALLPFIALGAIALGILSAGLLVFSRGVSSLMAVNFEGLVTQISQLAQINYMPILGLAAALTTLAFALTAIGIAGIAALPALAGLALAGGALSMIFGGEQGGENTDKALLEEIRALRADMASGKIAVNLDGIKVNAQLGRANLSDPRTFVSKILN